MRWASLRAASRATRDRSVTRSSPTALGILRGHRLQRRLVDPRFALAAPRQGGPAIERDVGHDRVWAVGIIPVFIGIALLLSSWLVWPRGGTGTYL